MKLKREKINLGFRNKRISIECRRCSSFMKAAGLMFTRREKAEPLLFDFKKQARVPIHSLFVFFPFLAICTGNRGKIVDIKVIEPFRLSVRPKKPFLKLIEIPVNSRYSGAIQLLVGEKKSLKRKGSFVSYTNYKEVKNG